MVFGVMSYPVFWFIVMVVCAVVEAATLGIITIWFAIGALITMFAAMLGAPMWLQIVIFFAVSIVLLVFTRDVAIRVLKIGREKTNSDLLIGRRGKVLKEIDPIAGSGQVKVSGQIWSAVSSNQQKIPADSLVTVLEITGVRLVVEPAEKE